MTAVLFDTFSPARKLEEAGFPSQQAQATSAAFAEILTGEVATRRDIDESRIALERRIDGVRQDLEAKIAALDLKIDRLDAKIDEQARDLA